MQEATVSFDFATACYNSHPFRLDVVLLVLAAWKLVAWLTERESGEPAVAIPTALTAIFVVAPFQVSWFVNAPAMLLLSLAGELSPWAAVAVVWTLSFATLKGMEWMGRRTRLVELKLAA